MEQTLEYLIGFGFLAVGVVSIYAISLYASKRVQKETEATRRNVSPNNVRLSAFEDKTILTIEEQDYSIKFVGSRGHYLQRL